MLAYDASDPALRSRHAARRVRVEGDTDQQKERHLLSLLSDMPDEGAVIIATSDRLVSLVSNHQDELLPKFRFRLPPRDVLDALNDKRRETALIEELGFPVPKTVQEVPDTPAALAERLRLPIIFKPYLYSAESVFPLKNAVVTRRDQLDEFYLEWRKALPVLLAQEVIPGPDSASWICSCTYDERHELLDCGIKQKLRAFPPHFGGSTFAVSRHNEEIIELTKRLGKALRYVGHAGIEFRWDERDNEYKYIEINPRMPANVGFDEACGLRTVWNSYRVSAGEPPEEPVRRQRDGVWYLDLKHDLRSSGADGIPKARFLADALRRILLGRTSGPYFAWDDPLPGMVVAARFCGNFLCSLGQRSGLRAGRLKEKKKEKPEEQP